MLVFILLIVNQSFAKLYDFMADFQAGFSVT